MKLSEDQKFDALKLRYNEQAELLKHMKQNEFRLVFGFLSLQLILCSFVLKTENPIGIPQITAIGILVLFSAVALTIMLGDYKKRRKEVLDTLRNIMTIFKFYEISAYAEEIKVNPDPPKLSHWSNWYRVIVWVSLLSTLVVAVMSISDQVGNNKDSNQRVDLTVKTSVESGNEQGTAGHP